MRIDRMVNQIKKFGVLKPNQYLIEFGGMVGAADLMLFNRMSLMCSSVSLPARSIATVEDKNSAGAAENIPYAPIYGGELEISFYLAKDLWERRIFETWMDMIIDPVTGRLGYYRDYTTEMYIYVLNEFSMPLYKIRLEDVYPKAVGAVALSNEGGTEVAKQTITISFKRYVPTIVTVGLAHAEEMLYEVNAVREFDEALGGFINNAGILGGKFGNPLNFSQVFDSFARDGRVVTQPINKFNLGSLGKWI